VSALAATIRVRASLDTIANALRSPDLQGLLAAEQELGAALHALGRVCSVEPHERAEMHRELMRMKVALLRCRTFGSVVEGVTEATLVSQGRGGEYNRAGARPIRGRAYGPQVKARM
jgi:hypothetical protein